MIDLNFNKLRKLEFADYAKGVIRIVGKYDLEALKIEGIANQLLAKQAEVEELVVAYGKHPLTEKIGVRRNDRDKIVSAIVDHLSSVQTASIGSTKMQLDLVAPFVHRHFDGLKKANQNFCRIVLSVEPKDGQYDKYSRLVYFFQFYMVQDK